MSQQIISKSAIDRAGNILAKEKFKTYEEWVAADKIFDDFRQAHLQPLTSTTIAIQNWFRADNATIYYSSKIKTKTSNFKKIEKVEYSFDSAPRYWRFENSC